MGIVDCVKVATFLQKKYVGKNVDIRFFSTLDKIEPNSIVFAKKYSDELVEKLNDHLDILVIAINDYQNKLKCPHILSANPRLDYLRVIDHFFNSKEKKKGIHPSAVIEQEVGLGQGVYIGANCYIGKDVNIGDNTEIHHNVVILGNVSIGRDCYIKSGAVIGEEGFGFEVNEEGIPEHFPHAGKIEIGNNVFIGSNTTIERGTIGATIIEDNVKIDDLVQIGHNSRTGKNTMITVGAVLCGGVIVGNNCYVAPHVTVREKVVVEDDCFLGMGAVVLKDVTTGTTIIGNPGKVLVK